MIIVILLTTNIAASWSWVVVAIDECEKIHPVYFARSLARFSDGLAFHPVVFDPECSPFGFCNCTRNAHCFPYCFPCLGFFCVIVIKHATSVVQPRILSHQYG
uniref:Putative secreted protein n=1 Tax=Anopheles darlingi TaxID=43151 RepID=A0A2M4DHY8_ANODA